MVLERSHIQAFEYSVFVLLLTFFTQIPPFSPRESRIAVSKIEFKNKSLIVFSHRTSSTGSRTNAPNIRRQLSNRGG